MLRLENTQIFRILGDGGGNCILRDTLLPSDDKINVLGQFFDQAFEALELLRRDDALDGQARVQSKHQLGLSGHDAERLYVLGAQRVDLHERAGAAGGAAAEELQSTLFVRGGGGDGHQPHDLALLELVRHLRERHVEPAVHRHLLRRQLVQRAVHDAREIRPRLNFGGLPGAHGAVEAVVHGVFCGLAVVRAVHGVQLSNL